MTSFGVKFVNNAARSPGFVIAGPDVIFNFAPISFAIIPASVVLPSPGGPYNKTWSSDSPLCFAASIYTFMLSFTFVCPMYSSSICGRNVVSSFSSLLSVISGFITKFSFILHLSSNFLYSYVIFSKPICHSFLFRHCIRLLNIMVYVLIH